MNATEGIVLTFLALAFGVIVHIIYKGTRMNPHHLAAIAVIVLGLLAMSWLLGYRTGWKWRKEYEEERG